MGLEVGQGSVTPCRKDGLCSSAKLKIKEINMTKENYELLGFIISKATNGLMVYSSVDGEKGHLYCTDDLYSAGERKVRHAV